MPQLFEYQGFGYASWWNGNFTAPASAEALDEIVGIQANSVAITASYFMASRNASDIYADPLKTESLANVGTAIDQAHERGLTVLLKPHVDPLDGAARSAIAPADIGKWFADYKTLLVDYARMAETHGAEMLSLGTEIDGLTGAAYHGYWSDIIASVRAVYSGQLTYGANWDAAGRVSFWDQLDLVGVDGYVPLSLATDASVADMIAGWTAVPTETYYRTLFEGLSPVDYYRQLAEQTGKPLLFTEIGYRSLDGAARNPSDTYSGGAADAQEQADLYNAFFHVWSQQGGDWFKGAFAWHWSPKADAAAATDYQVEGKPAADIVADWLAGNPPPIDTAVKHRTLTGTAGDDTLAGGIGNDVLDGRGSAAGDLLIGGSGAGDDIFIIRNALDRAYEQDGGGNDILRTDLAAFTLPGYVERMEYIGKGSFAGTGNWLVNTLVGGAGADTLDGAGGADTMIGGAGNDTYYVDNAGDQVIELAGGGRDLVYSSVSLTLSAHADDLILTGPYNLTGIGNTLGNRITGNAAHNLLDGGGSTAGDTLSGGAGNDTYIVTNVRDRVIETASDGSDSGGIDLVRTSLASFDLASAANVENLTFTGPGAFRGYGNALANRLTGGAGNDTLYGVNGDGADTLAGGAGDDMYVVHSAADKVSEAAGGGFDTIRTDAASFTLPANVECLFFTGTGAFSATGSSGADSIIGGAGNDMIDGRLGADTMKGGNGDDTYYVESAQDLVSEWANGGRDRVYSTVTFALPENVEDLTLLTGGYANATGNRLDNVLTGGEGANVLDGGGSLAGDTLIGGAGNDTYIVASARDRVVETGADGSDSGGFDIIRTGLASYDMSQAAHVEKLVYTGAGAFRGTGNAGDNQISGGAGADRLDGGRGADILAGGAGADTFVFAKGETGGDLVTDFSHAQGDVLELRGFAAGSTISRVAGSWSEWQIVDAADHSQEVIRLATAPALVAGDWHFV